jgi:hypothetical protein
MRPSSWLLEHEYSSKYADSQQYKENNDSAYLGYHEKDLRYEV